VVWSVAEVAACLRNYPERGRTVLFDRHAADVGRVLLRLLGSDPDVPDLVHEVFVTAMAGSWHLRVSTRLLA
jgi:DNA-directed RNA polymerase specialized sigma24 family protein